MTGGESMVKNIQLRQMTDCIREISAGLEVAVTDKARKGANHLNANRSIDYQKELVVYGDAGSDPRFASNDTALEHECSSGVSEPLGYENEVTPLARSRGPRRGPAGTVDLLCFLAPIGFVMVIVVMTGILIGASLPANLPSRPSPGGGTLSIAAFAHIEEPISGPSAVAAPPAEPAMIQPDSAYVAAAEAPTAPPSLPATPSAVVPAAPQPLSPPALAQPAVAMAVPSAAAEPTPPPPVAPAAPAAASPPIASAPLPAKPTNQAVLTDTQRQALLSRGDAFLIAGDVMSARLFYQRGADAGDSMAALRLGETFDAAFLQRAGLGRVANDPKKAAVWYRRARDLGNAEAEILLKVLHAN
jgi:hypothetical protein